MKKKLLFISHDNTTTKNDESLVQCSCVGSAVFVKSGCATSTSN